MANNLGTNNDDNFSGKMTLFNPSSAVFVKHFIVEANYSEATPYSINFYCAGYGNTTSAIDGVRFQFNTANIDSGKIKLYGIKDS